MLCCKIQSLLLLATVFFVHITAAFVVVRQSISQVQADFQNIISNLNDLKIYLTNYPSVIELVNAGSKLLDLTEEVQKTTDDVIKNGFIDESESVYLLTEGIRPSAVGLIQVLHLLIFQKPIFDLYATESPDLIPFTEGVLEDLNKDVEHLTDALLENVPQDAYSTIVPLSIAIEDLFVEAIEVYSGWDFS